MLKVIKAELKKMVSKPGIFILAAFLAVILVLGVFLYRPDVRKYDVEQHSYEMFQFEAAGNDKELADAQLANATKAVNSYFIQEDENKISYYVKMYGEDGNGGLWKRYNETCKDMQVKAKDDNAQQFVDDFLSVLNNINSTITTAVNGSGDLAHLILASQTNYAKYTALYKSIVSSTNADGVFSKEGLTLEEKINKYRTEYQSSFESVIASFKFPTISDSLLKKYTDADTKDTNLNIINKRLDELNAAILKTEEDYNNTPNNEANKKKLDELTAKYINQANLYRNTVNVYYNLVKYELMSNAFSFVNTSERFDLMNLSDQTEYNSDTQLIKYTYLFNNNKTDRDYSNPLAVGSTITDKVTAYDYTFFILKLFSFIIIAYAIMSSCGAIAGEIKDGSMRYYAIRPINRNNILFGKLLAISIMSAIILVFSTIIAMCVGTGVYGWTNLNILTIFNGSHAIVMHPLGMIALFMLSFIIEMLVYSSLAFLLSSLLKSDLLASTLMLLIYLINIILPVFAGGMNSWLAFYPFSHISLFALFGSSIVITGNDMLSTLLKVNVYASTSLIPMLVVTIILIVVPIFFAGRIFKRKEL